MKTRRDKILFLLFFISGFCGLLYQLVWVRLAFASFGVITPVLSVVISVFMLGLSLGSWIGGKIIKPLKARIKISAIYFYAGAEFIIGIGAFAVPKLFLLGDHLLLRIGDSASFSYLFFSALVIAAALFPWCVFMGTTFPFVMAFVKEYNPESHQSFSYLYLANVIGAMISTIATTLLLVEFLGFKHTLWTAAGGNFFIAAVSLLLASGHSLPAEEVSSIETRVNSQRSVIDAKIIYAILFTTGFSSMAMEVAWTRMFAPILGNLIYAFAALLFVYLLATWVGSYIYRRDLKLNKVQPLPILISFLSIFSFLPIFVNDPRINPYLTMVASNGRAALNIDSRVFPILVSIFPFCALLGYLTPSLIDEFSEGDPQGAGRAYACNIIGCILGPLVASYLLLPYMGAKVSLIVLAVPFFGFYFIYFLRLTPKIRYITATLTILFLLSAVFYNISYEENPLGIAYTNYIVRRDYTATVVSVGSGMDKGLLVNGTPMTSLSTVGKIMADLPMVAHSGNPKSALVICFGMGTTYRAFLNWDINVTAVELVPSVVKAFPYYYEDGEAVMNNPRGRIIIDDGRRFLRRTNEKFDIITIDPAPPPESSGSALLHSEEFYDLIKQRLQPDGILQHWFVLGKEKNVEAMVRSLKNSFPYIRVFIYNSDPSGDSTVQGVPEYLFLASCQPIKNITADEMVAHLPDKVKKDLFEWNDFRLLKPKEIPITQIMDADPSIKITDDLPFNEYFLMRQIKASLF